MRARSLFLKCPTRFKNGKEHRCWSLSENQRGVGGRMVQRQVLCLGEINDCQRQDLYRCLDRLLAHQRELFTPRRQRWVNLFGAQFDVLLYDLTSTYFESDPPEEETDQRRFGDSRDQRSDGVPVVLALVWTPEG
jgi:hypothetical protein